MLWNTSLRTAALAAIGLLLVTTRDGACQELAGPTPAPTPTLNRRQLGVETVISATRISGTLTVLTIAPSPTAATGCTLHIDHWDCETGGDEHAGHDHAEGAEEDHSGHDHAEGAEEDHSGHDHGAESSGSTAESSESGDSHAGHSHAGHSHGPSAEFGCGLAPLEGYNLGLHIGAIFILLATSGFGVFGPLVLRGISNRIGTTAGRLFSEALFICRHFGTGVLLSTAFVHLLFHGLIGFSNECIGELTYEAVGPAIAMAGVWLVFIVDVFLLRGLRQRAAARGAAAAEVADLDSNSPATSTHEGKGDSDSDNRSERGDSASLRSALQKLEQSEVLVLEAGILFHSVLIGVTLGVATGGFTPLLITIAFHQFFEGLALGSRLALTSLGAVKKFAAAALYALITPVGIAIGVGVRRSFNSNDSSTLIAIGTLQSLSAGILLYAAIELMINDFMRRPGSSMSLPRTVAALTVLTVGCALMSVLAKWA